MNKNNLELAKKLIPATYVKQAEDEKNSREKLISILLTHRKLPETGWSDHMIESFLYDLSAMDSNNFSSNCGLGEREGRIASNLVAKRHYNFGHGIGRSGDLIESQPKAAGSSLIQNLTNRMIEDLFSCLGFEKGIKCLVVPTATSMALVLTILSFKQQKPNAQYILWSRIDQKACFKSIITAGCTPIIIDTILINDQLSTDLDRFKSKTAELGSENVLCILTTTSCFAPRGCDNILEIGKICEENNIFHIINNAYGLQDEKIVRMIFKTSRKSKVDAFIQSTDKNLMVPVGGAIIASYNAKIINEISKTYPGRASSSPVIDTFITLLSLGKHGYLKLIEKRKKMHELLLNDMTKFAKEINEKILETPDNPISVAMTLNLVPKENLTKLGSMLFIRNVSGTRIVTTDESKTISGYQFKGWGSHTNNFHTPYLTAAAAIGMEHDEIYTFIKRLHKIFKEIKG